MSGSRRTLALDAAVFTALAWFAAAHWADGLVADAPSQRVSSCVLIALAAGIAITLVPRSLPAAARAALRLAGVAAAVCAGAVAIGLDAGLLAPGRWGELADGVDRGFAGLGAVEWPYDGPEPWSRLVLLLAIPIVLGLAAALAFWPGRRLRSGGLVLLVALYATAVTEHRFGGELARGVAALLLIGAWLWLPRLPERGRNTAIAAAGAVAFACLLALPAAARYDERPPWVDYEKWNPFQSGGSQRFDWSHSYGPIDWPRDGTTLMYVRSDKRHYWKVETLDRFDGFGWARRGDGRGRRPLFPSPYRLPWESRFRVTIQDLDTELFPIAGTAVAVQGAESDVLETEDGTVETVGGRLEAGDSYVVNAYVPDPTPRQMRAAPALLPSELSRYLEVYLPPPGTTALDGAGRAGDAARSAIDAGQAAATEEEIASSPYARVLRLARRIARDERTAYDKVIAVQRYLRSQYTYSERPPSQEFPLAAFLFEDRIGYCQQFSGAMALMLRMLDLPARVAAGFTPGSYNRDTKEYRVRDLDAHSWVEVWFTGVGWVPFDPTPAVAPAESQSGPASAASGGALGAAEPPDRRGGQSSSALSERAGGGSLPDPGSSSDAAVEPWLAAAVLALAAFLAALFAAARARLARRRIPALDRDLAELQRALARTGGEPPAGMTLRALEGLLERRGGRAAARYAEMLRVRRYAPGGGPAPGKPERRELRRALAAGRGVRGRLRAWAALPPAAFRRG